MQSFHKCPAFIHHYKSHETILLNKLYNPRNNNFPGNTTCDLAIQRPPILANTLAVHVPTFKTLRMA